MHHDFVTASANDRVGDVLQVLRLSGRKNDEISYIYIVNEEKILAGVVDLRELVLANDDATMGTIMTTPVVSAEATDMREDIADLFDKYHYRMLPIVSEDRLVGVVYFNDIMKGPAKT